MKDIDFDELDRAVSSVLSQKTSATDSPTTNDATIGAPQSAAADTGAAVAVTTSTAVVEEDAPSTKTVDESPEVNDEAVKAETNETTPTSAPLAVRRRGKFMDVMHPSHDMAPGSATPTPTPVSATRRSIAPLSPASEIVAEAKEDVPTAAEVEEMAPSVVEAAVTDEPATTDSSYVDPLDFMAKTDEASEESPEPPVEVAPVETMPDPLETASSTPAEEAPVATPAPSTPFLTDTQVEKRPLGAFGDDEATTPAVETAAAEAAPVDEATSMQEAEDTQTAPAVLLPRELQPDVVKVEAIQDDTQAPEEVPAGVVEAAAAESATSHPLFDTSTYHEPTAAKSGKKIPGWMLWLIGFLICLIVGAGVGYFLFSAGL